ncbi:AsmA-like C-terminal region-containing protein [Cognatitamlana onchidii]|uniref:AsmA-like C-terminal region-containing protein n=1 Tax=Cognatitamlana onchidii TaxID=2562860 RepID=UPI0010A5BC6D|nr:AsmA-like C-terminal region-containing protein [Algibacter onchidii]
MKKIFKITGITILVFITLILVIPFAFQNQIKEMVKTFVNQNLNAKVEFSDVSLSFIKSFPQAHVSVSDLTIINFEPFKDETFASVKDIAFSMSLKELFKTADEDPVTINTIYVNEALLTLKTDKFGNNNYNITKVDSTKTSTKQESSTFALSIQDYQIKNSALTYIDETASILALITELNHEGHGTFSATTSELKTQSKANISISLDSINYLNSNPIKLDATIGLDLVNNKYSFKDNKGFVNDLPLHFEGFIQMVENGQNIDITFENPESSFKDFLAVIPRIYSKNIEHVETSGDFKIKGLIKGLSSDTTIPTLDISITSNNASFKYPDLPKRVDNITINTIVKNTSGFAKDTYININRLDFKIDDDVFKSSINLKNITENIWVDAHIDGLLNLGKITQVYPIELENELSGILKGKLNTSFDMNALETNAYERIKTNGSANISDFTFSSQDIVNPIHITQADMIFKPGSVTLDNFMAETGKSDLNAHGTMYNLLGFLLSDNTLKGEFNVESNLFRVSDFMTEDKTVSENNKKTADTQSLKIPDFLDCTINAKAKTVIYDNINLKDLKGTLTIKDQTALLQNMSSHIFDGDLSISGDVSTKQDTPSFNLNLGVQNFDIAQSFKTLELFKNIAPVAKILDGKFNTDLKLSGNLNKDFLPDLTSLSGNALAELLVTNINKEDELVSALDDALGFLDFEKLDLQTIEAQLEFNEGKVAVKPFDFKYEDIEVEVSGTHGFDKSLNYNAVFNVPAKYLGNDINRLISNVNDEDINNIAIPVTANIGGNYFNPVIKTDLKQSVKKLSNQLIDIQKQKLLHQGKKEVDNLINDVLGSNESKTDSLKQEQNNTIKDVLESFTKPNSTDTDSTKTDQTTETVKGVLNSFLGKKKKDTAK